MFGLVLAAAPLDANGVAKGSASPAAAADTSQPGNTPSPGNTSPPADAVRTPEMDEAEALLRAGDIGAARQKLAEAQKKNPRLATPAVIVARWYLANNQTAAGRTELEQVIAALPDEPEPYALLGELAWGDRRIAETELLFREAIARAQTIKNSPARRADVETTAHAGLATVAEARRRWSTARDELAALIKLDEKNPNAHQRLGYALFQLGKPKEALAEFQAAARQNADFTPEIALATLYEEAGDRENATKWMNAAIKRLPGNAPVRLAVANWELEASRVAKAKLQVEAALKADPKSLDAKILAGGIARLQKDLPAAEHYLEAAHLQSPTSFAASNLLALVLADQDDAAKQARALEFATQNVERHPQNSEAIATLGWAYFRLGRWSDASRNLNQALGTGTLNADGAYFVAKMCERDGRAADARTLLAKALATKRLFAYQQDAEQLLARLGAGSASTSTSTSPPAKAEPAPKAAK
jgi:tetratricopeptide (TPR) repeat protein